MKVKKSQLRKMVQEAIHAELKNISSEQKRLAEEIGVYLDEAPFLKEYKEVKSKEKLLEFFGPFKRLKVQDLEDMSAAKDAKTVADEEKETLKQQKATEKQRAKEQKADAKRIAAFTKAVEQARKQLASTKLSNPDAVQAGLESYVDKLVDLYQVLDVVNLDDRQRAQVVKPFAAAAYTLQGLQQALSDASEELFSAVPRDSGVYSAGREAQDIEGDLKKTLRSPLDMAKDFASSAVDSRGMGVGRGRPPS